MHSMDPKHIGQNYNWVGPGTDISTREKLHDDIPLNKLDAAAKKTWLCIFTWKRRINERSWYKEIYK